MDLAGAAGQALQMIFTWQYLAYILIGVTMGNIVGVIPGIGGNFALAVMIPFIYYMDPVLAIGFLEGAHAATATGGAVTSILVNVPGDSQNAATCLDGYPMMKKGEGGRAVGASAMSSGVGGVVGAVILLVMLPVVRPLVLSFGPPEILAMILAGIAMIAYIGEGDTVKALVAGLVGLGISFIGDDISTGVLRYTFGVMYLQDGINVIPVVIGMFAFAEMLLLLTDKTATANIQVEKASFASVLEGCKDCFRNWWLMVRCGAIGTLVGLVPGLGGTAAGFIAYGHAVQSDKNPKTFGTGRVEGVIAPEAANNSKEGGNLVTMLAFGLPGNSSMAVIMGALIVLGMTPGPKMLGEQLPMTLVVVWTLVIGNVLAALQIILMANPMAKLASVRPSIMIPAVLALSSLGAYAGDNNVLSLVVAVVFGLVGFEMKRFGFSRATLIIGLVLGAAAEQNYNLSMTLWGPAFVLRPITLVILGGVAALLIWLTVKGLRKKEEED